jgi:DNA-binding XRE family transcriptional regulator
MKRLTFGNYLKKELRNREVKKAFNAEELPAKIALMLAKLREEKDLSQAELAKRLGVPQQTVSKIERQEHTNLTISTLQNYAKALGKELIIELR